MKYRVEGGVAAFGIDMVLGLSKDQVAARVAHLEKVDGGYRPTSVVQFKSGEELSVNCKPDDLPRSLAVVLVPASKPRTAAKGTSKSKESTAPASVTPAAGTGGEGGGKGSSEGHGNGKV